MQRLNYIRYIVRLIRDVIFKNTLNFWLDVCYEWTDIAHLKIRSMFGKINAHCKVATKVDTPYESYCKHQINGRTGPNQLRIKHRV